MGDSYKNTGSFTALSPPGSGATSAQGVFPGATPKYAKQASRTDGYKDTMARLYLFFKDPAAQQKYFDPYITALSDTRLRDQLKSKIAGSSPGGLGYIEFLLQSAVHRYAEHIDVIETLADKYVAYAYGSAPPVFSYQIAMLNNKQDDQAANMYRLYWHVLRATRLANTQAEVYFEYDKMLVCGAISNFNWSLQANDESYCQGSFDILVRKLLLLPDTTSNGSAYDKDAASLSTDASVNTSNFQTVTAVAGPGALNISL